jgi:hypothetical protein
MDTSSYPPARDPETVPKPTFREPDYDDPIIDPENDSDTGELPDEDEEYPDIDDEDLDDEEDPVIDDEDDDLPEGEPLRA